MIPKVIQGSEASGVMFGDQKASLVLSVSISTREAIQAIEHVLAIKETGAKLQECNYLRRSLPKLQECTRIRSLCCLNQMDLCWNCS